VYVSDHLLGPKFFWGWAENEEAVVLWVASEYRGEVNYFILERTSKPEDFEYEDIDKFDFFLQ
jgi:hypothetical protein